MTRVVHSVISVWKSFLIFLERALDHAYREVIGVPTLKRSEITPQLYLGGQYTARGFHILRERGITAIVSMRERAREGLPDLGEVKFLHLPTRDRHAPTLSQLDQGAAFIEDAINNNGKVYVHCAFGEGRGPTMVIAYLLKIGLTLEDALAQVKAVRRFIYPTSPQMSQLRAFHARLHPEISPQPKAERSADV
jgi:dual specificity MAP kinase phosphatase